MAEKQDLWCNGIPCAMYGRAKMALCREKFGDHEGAIKVAEGMMRDYAQFTYAPGVHSEQRDNMEAAKGVAYLASKNLGDEERATYWLGLMEKNSQGQPVILVAWQAVRKAVEKRRAEDPVYDALMTGQ
ncbi:MAG: hypothetical protein AB1916_04845 [Thermodesulfobacteriota bacterium]